MSVVQQAQCAALCFRQGVSLFVVLCSHLPPIVLGVAEVLVAGACIHNAVPTGGLGTQTYSCVACLGERRHQARAAGSCRAGFCTVQSAAVVYEA